MTEHPPRLPALTQGLWGAVAGWVIASRGGKSPN